MIYSSVEYADLSDTNAGITMTITCSHCRQVVLLGNENFCPHCGEKLVHIPKDYPSSKLAEALNFALARPTTLAPKQIKDGVTWQSTSKTRNTTR